MIDPHSKSYAILGAAQATGVDYGLALAYVQANRRWYAALDAVMTPQEAHDGIMGLVDAYEAIERATTPDTAAAFRERINAALEEGRIYWPYSARPLGMEKATALPDRVEGGGDTWDGKPFDADFPLEGAKWPGATDGP